MKILLVAATQAEVQPLIDHCQSSWQSTASGIFKQGQTTIEFMITGVGMVRTAYALGSRLATEKPDLCVNAGICGAFPSKFAIGDVVHVVTERIYGLGAEDANGQFLRMEDLALPEDISSSFGLVNSDAAGFAFLPIASGITVNTVHGAESSIAEVIGTIDPDIESMEGAAFFYCCLKAQVKFLAIRSVSNLVEPRNRDNWDIPLAIANLNTQLLELIYTLTTR